MDAEERELVADVCGGVEPPSGKAVQPSHCYHIYAESRQTLPDGREAFQVSRVCVDEYGHALGEQPDSLVFTASIDDGQVLLGQALCEGKNKEHGQGSCQHIPIPVVKAMARAAGFKIIE